MSALPAVVNTGPPPLTELEERFCHAYLGHFCATQAYLAVCPHVKPSSARNLGSRLYAKVHVKERIKELTGRVLAGSVMTKQQVLEELDRLANSDISEMQDPETLDFVRDLRSLPLGARRSLRSVKVKHYPARHNKQGEEIAPAHDLLEFTVHDKLKALEMLGKYHKLYDELLPSGVKEVIVRLVRE